MENVPQFKLSTDFYFKKDVFDILHLKWNLVIDCSCNENIFTVVWYFQKNI